MSTSGPLREGPVCIVAIAKGEQTYIPEFMRYHLALGFDKIVLYDNEDTPTYDALLKEELRPAEYAKLHILHFPHRPHYTDGVQYRALDHFIKHFLRDYGYAMHIDVDEFLVLKKHPDIQSFIREWIDPEPLCAGVGFNWKLFGDAGQASPFPEEGGSGEFSVLKRFTKSERKLNRHIKTLFRTRDIQRFSTVHHIQTKRPGTYIKSVETVPRKISGPFHHTEDDSVAQLNHYKVKSRAEFQRIWRRGRADFSHPAGPNQVRMKGDLSAMQEVFDRHNKNEVEDTTARDFYLSRVLV